MEQIRISIPESVALTIAGSDPSGGAGLQADLKAFQQLGVYGMSAVTLITVQNTRGVERVEVLSPELIVDQIDVVLRDISPHVIKVGALGNAEVVGAVGERLADVECPIVVDPVMVSKHGDSMVTDDVVDAYMQYLLPHAYIVTPNRFETERLTGIKPISEATVEEAIRILVECGVQYPLIKLGEVDGRSQHVLGLENEYVIMEMPRFSNSNTHGTGCILSATIAAKLALGSSDIREAVSFGIERTFEAISVNTRLGSGVHPAETRAMQRN